MNNKELKKKKIRRASLRERFYFLLTGRIPNYAMRANSDVSWAWLNILHDPKSEIKYFRNMPDNEKKIIKNFLCTNRISNRKEQVEAFESHFGRNYPILACTMVKQCNWEGDESWDEERPFAYDKDGHAAGTAPADKLELFLISEPELTEFEYAVQEIFYKGRETDIDLLKITSDTLLKVARKQLTAELPHWRKCETDPRFPGAIRSYVGYWDYRGYEIDMEEVFNKLPKED